MTKIRRRVLVTLESRATMGYTMNVMRALLREPSVELLTLVTGGHLMSELGQSVSLYEGSGIPISAKVEMSPGEGPAAWSKALGTAIAGYAEAFERLHPDIILIAGDRIETFGLCTAASYMGLPMAHIQAGDKSGHIDDMARMAIAKLAHIHLAPGQDAVERLRRLGEEEFRIFDTGAPQLDDMVDRDFRRTAMDINGRVLDMTKPYLLLLQHPLMVERDEARAQMRTSLDACLSSGLPVVWIYPNSDLGFRDILSLIEEEQDSNNIHAVANLARDDYLALLACCACLVGNSSSGLLEAPTFKVPVVNVGDRQRGRPQASNILNCPAELEAIKAAITTALGDPEFHARCREATNPFGDGRSSARIVSILANHPLDKSLLDKVTVY